MSIVGYGDFKYERDESWPIIPEGWTLGNGWSGPPELGIPITSGKGVSDVAVDSNDRVLNQIKKLSELRKDGVLTEEEFNKNKKLLLDKLN